MPARSRYDLTIAKGADGMKKELEKLLAEADRLYKIAMDDNVDEEAQDEAYSEYHEINKKIAAWIEKFSMGMIKGDVALRMAVHKKSEILELVTKWRGF
jgi:hypothetical protein